MPEINNAESLTQAIDRLYSEMADVPTDSESYQIMVQRLETLYQLQELNSKKKVSADTVALILGNLAGIVIIVGYESKNIVTSKALSFVSKLR